MFTLSSTLHYYLYSESTDMRKSVNGLSGIITNILELSPTSGDVYVFINKPRNKMKLLHWSPGGFVLYYKRLETGTFESLSYDITESTFKLSYTDLVFLIDGISIKNTNKNSRFFLNK